MLFCDTRGQARARELVDAALGDREIASITRVRLSNKSYSAEAAGVIAEALKQMISITEVPTEYEYTINVYGNAVVFCGVRCDVETLLAVCNSARPRTSVHASVDGGRGIETAFVLLWHFCSLDGLQGVCISGGLWGNDVEVPSGSCWKAELSVVESPLWYRDRPP